jgi:multiple sugar transport system permease protein
MAKVLGLKRHGPDRGNPLLRVLLFLVVLVIGLTMIIPFYWMLSSSLKLEHQIWLIPPLWFPNPIEWRNYLLLYEALPDLPRYILNSVFTSVTITVGSLLFNALAGYGFARYQFKGRDLIFGLLLATMMIPGSVTMIPVFIFVKMVGWINTYQGLIVPGLAGAFGVFFMRQFFLTIPNDLIDAGRIDGASEYRIFAQVAMPLARTAFSALTIFTFLGAWNDYMWPATVLRSDSMATLPLFIARLSRGLSYVMSYRVAMAGASSVVMPVIIVFLVLQRHFIEGIALTGIKG